ncbi:hypothetical protein [uncultured Cohaesibacter sp.]|nr:hypothetical protein [uncultured Cohaesibacter sp.]
MSTIARTSRRSGAGQGLADPRPAPKDHKPQVFVAMTGKLEPR